ncbi:MAG TPA: tetratricopeptide repeat protein [Roseomonas sp.]
MTALQTGAAWLRCGRLDEAKRHLSAAVEAQPGLADAQMMLGVIHGMQGQPTEAATCFRTALRLRPGSADAHGNLGNALRELGHAEEAAGHLRQALHLRPDYAEAHNNLGAALLPLGQVTEAEACFRSALHLRPDFIEARGNLGRLLLAESRPDEAVTLLQAALRDQPGAAPLWATLGAALRAAGRPGEAARALHTALRQAPATEAIWTEFGNALYELNRPGEAAAAFRKALEIRADSPSALLGLAVAQAQLGCFGPAEAAARDALRHQPDFAEAGNALGDILRNQGRLAESEAALREALRLRPDYPDARVHLAFTLLQAGRFAEGWQAHEHREGAKAWARGRRRFPVPRWQGEPLAGRRLLLHAEQGLGDTIQFSRYLVGMAPDAGVLVQVQAPLLPLLRGQFGRIALLGDAEPLPAFDLEAPLLSLPHLLGDVAAPTPYLTPDAGRLAAWRARLAAMPGIRVGLVWAGNPGMAADARRSIALAALHPLGAVPGITFVSLQHGPAASEPTPAGLPMLATDLHDFVETAALVAALDLVIGVDTAVIHLAGALGRPVWLLNRADTCWRWGNRPGDSAWYPTLREFRQPAHGDWGSVVAAVRQALMDFAPGTAP